MKDETRDANIISDPASPAGPTASPSSEARSTESSEAISPSRRAFLKSAASLGAAAGAISLPRLAAAEGDPVTPSSAGVRQRPGLGKPNHYYVPANAQTVRWGYFSKTAKPIVEVNSGDLLTIETVTHQASDDYERMVKGDPGVESIYYWTKTKKNVNRRGAGPMDAPNGAGAGWGVHVVTGPVFVRGAEPGDILEVRILDVRPRPCANPEFAGKSFGTNIAAWWGFQYNDLIEEPKPREVVTIYEIDAQGERDWATAVYSYVWTPQTDPFGVVHKIYDYPGVVVDPKTIKPRHGVLKNARVPIRPHFGTMGLAPKEANLVNSIPPAYFGGNIDDWRIGKGGVMYYPVAVEGALLSVGDPHAAQGDSELAGTAIECSLTGLFQVVVHKRSQLAGTVLEGLEYPLLETKEQWVVHGFSYPDYLNQLGANAQKEIFERSSLDKAMRDAFRKMRGFLMSTQKLSEDEAISLMSVAVDFGVTQVVDGNWGVHASIRKSVFAGGQA
jgi:acetamidase/formamidase